MIDLTDKIKRGDNKSLDRIETNTPRNFTTPFAYARTKNGLFLQILGCCWLPATLNGGEYYFKCYECLYYDKESGDRDLYIGTFYNDQIEEFLSI